MLPERNACDRIEAGPLGDIPVEGTKEFIAVVFDLDDPAQAEGVERHRAAFGHGHAEVEPCGDGKVVLKLYAGGARRLP